MFCLLALVSIATAQDENVVLSLKNINTDEPIDSVVVYVDIAGIELIKHVGADKTLDLSLADGYYTITLKIEEPSTDAKDYFKKQQIAVNGSLEEDVYLFPVGSLRGMVKDTFDNVVGDAELRFECTNEIGTDLPAKTNKFGSFMVDYMPIGSCKIFANFGEAVGFTEVEVQQGNITDVEVSLDRTILSMPGKGYGMEAFVGILFIVVAILLIFKYKNKLIKKIKKQTRKEAKAEEKKEHREPAKETRHERAKDITATLHKKERDIVEYLLSKKEETNQANIRHNTGIPRTSLTRILASLEQKNIIKVRKVGKVVKVRLTDWFLGKE